MPPICVGFWVENTLSKGPFSADLYFKHGWVFQKLPKHCQKMGSFPPKFIIKVGMTATVGN